VSGWRVFDGQDGRYYAAGMPSLVMVRRGRLLFAQLVAERGKIPDTHRRWLVDLSACPGIEVHAWRPSSWPDIERALS
jgi:hypothetical protein